MFRNEHAIASNCTNLIQHLGQAIRREISIGEKYERIIWIAYYYFMTCFWGWYFISLVLLNSVWKPHYSSMNNEQQQTAESPEKVSVQHPFTYYFVKSHYASDKRSSGWRYEKKNFLPCTKAFLLKECVTFPWFGFTNNCKYIGRTLNLFYTFNVKGYFLLLL